MRSLEQARVEEAQALCARGLLAWVTGDVDDARRNLEAAIEKSRRLEEAYEARATLELEAGEYAASVEWWTKGIAQDRGHVPHWEGRGAARRNWGLCKAGRGEDPTADYAAAIGDLGEALKRNRINATTWWYRGNAHHGRARWKRSRRQNAADDFRAALADYEEAVRLNPGLERVLRPDIDDGRRRLAGP